MKGSAAIRGATRILLTVIAFGRFTASELSGERLQHQLANGFEGVENSVASNCDRLEIRRALDPLTGRQLTHEILSRVVWIRSEARFRGIRRIPSGIQGGLQLVHRRCVRQVAFVVLNDKWQTR